MGFIHDDDTFIRYEKQINKVLAHETEKDHLQCMFGYLVEERPLRWNKYQASAKQYPMGFKYPKFCHGPCMTITKSASTKIYQAAYEYVWNSIELEDVLFSGIMRVLSNVTSISI